jgi:hypothetical protein
VAATRPTVSAANAEASKPALLDPESGYDIEICETIEGADARWQAALDFLIQVGLQDA